MSRQRAFYSVVQYVPDRFRAEAVNVGLVLLQLEPHAIRSRMTDNFDRVQRLFRSARRDLKNLEFSIASLNNRVENSPCEFRTEKELSAFAASRANDLRLTHPRLTMLENLEADFERLFSALVEEPPIPTALEEPS